MPLFRSKRDLTENSETTIDKLAIRARNNLWATFFVMGISSMAWVPRIPEIKDQLGLGDGKFGLIFLAGALGSVCGSQISGRAIHRIASRKFAQICGAIMPIGIFVMGSAHDVRTLVIGLFLTGLTFSALDVAANVQGMAIENLTKARYMSSFHALWSVGAFAVTLFGGALARVITPQEHLKALAVISAILYLVTISGLLPGNLDGHRGESHEVTSAKIPFFAKEAIPLWALGIGLTASFIPEAGIYDWSGILLKDHMDIGKGLTAIAATTYSLGMIISRFLGDRWFEKWGHQKTAQYGGYIGGSAIAVGLIAGIPLSSLNKWLAVSIISICFAIAGLCMGPLFPAFNLAAMSLPGIAPSVGMARVALIAIAANFFGPALIGGISELTTLPISFALLAALLFLVGRQARFIKVKSIK
jgi:MFS family permease